MAAQASLSNILRFRYDQTRLDSDIGAAIEIGRAAVAATSPDDPAYPDRRSSIALALRSRFISEGRSEDIDDAVDLLTSIVEETGAHPDRARYLSNLAESLVVRLGVGATDDLIAEVDGVLEDQAGSATTQQERKQTRLATDRWLRPGLDWDADAADLYQQAIAATDISDPDYAVYLPNLAVLRGYQASRTGQPAESPTALDAMLNSIRTAEPGDPRRAGILVNLGSVRLGDEEHNHAPIGYLRQAATMPTAPAHVRLRAACTWAQAAAGAGDLTSATDAMPSRSTNCSRRRGTVETGPTRRTSCPADWGYRATRRQWPSARTGRTAPSNCWSRDGRCCGPVF